MVECGRGRELEKWLDEGGACLVSEIFENGCEREREVGWCYVTRAEVFCGGLG